VELTLLIPPVLFLVVLAFVWLEYRGLDGLTFKPHRRKLNQQSGESSTDGKYKSYACGEDLPSHSIQPDYRQFFHFAFFFTIIHVIALVVATVPSESIGASGLAIVFVISSGIGLYVLFRR
jgi:NADH:ubiquinone oxidoreductase subunit 3 (subunit A)